MVLRDEHPAGGNSRWNVGVKAMTTEETQISWRTWSFAVDSVRPDAADIVEILRDPH